MMKLAFKGVSVQGCKEGEKKGDQTQSTPCFEASLHRVLAVQGRGAEMQGRVSGPCILAWGPCSARKVQGRVQPSVPLLF